MGVLKVYNGASWITAIGKVYDGSVWKGGMNFYNGSAQVELYSTGPIVSLNTSGVTVLAPENPTIAGVQYNNSGAEFATDSNGLGSYTVSRGSWLDDGSTSDVWFERTINSGTLNHTDPGSGRLIMTSTRTLAVQDVTIPGGAVTCNVTVTMWDAASGGSKLDEVTYTLSAIREA